MSNDIEIGQNRVGMAASPIHGAQMRELEDTVQPTTPGTGEELSMVRLRYALQKVALGSVAPPLSLTGVARAAIAALKGNHPTMLFDKLGERLAFERTGTRLYEALLSKHEAYGSWDGGPTRAELLQIAEEELDHLHRVARAIDKLGGDPTTVTPSADVVAVQSRGLEAVVTDPRTNLIMSLASLHIMELADNDAWPILVALVRPVDDEIADSFEAALRAEARHLESVRTWLLSALDLAPRDLAERVHVTQAMQAGAVTAH